MRDRGPSSPEGLVGVASEPYTARPWLARYPAGMDPHLEIEHASALAMFAAAADGAPDRPLVHYLGRTLSFGEVAEVAAGLARRLGIEPGDRVALSMQNIPQFAIAMLATWMAGGVVVPVNPMLKERELAHQLDDSGASLLVTQDDLYLEVAAGVVRCRVITTNARDLAGEIPAALDVPAPVATGQPDLLDLASLGKPLPTARLQGDDVAFLTYTSGTTGAPKGAMNTHANVVFNATAYQRWIGLDTTDSVLAIAPLFHITGLVAHLAVAFVVPMPLVLGYRFQPEVVLDLVERYRPTFVVAAITAFTALMDSPSAGQRDASSLAKVYSGGAPVAPSVAERFHAEVGAPLHNIYGLTETTSPSHAVPFGATAPVDPATGALSVGVPIFDTVVRVVGDDGAPLPPGEVGELVTSGPQVVPGYWGKPEESAHAIREDGLHTGDVGFMDAGGWFYLVDRKKDMIIASGYKVWPREVEDVLYEHPAVREAAVVGVPDAYRGETVKAFVSLRPGREATASDFVTWCRERMAAYKYPRVVEIVDDLPKTATGKILRRELRAR